MEEKKKLINGLIHVLIIIREMNTNINGNTFYKKMKSALTCLFWVYVIGFLPMALFYLHSFPINQFPVGLPWYHILITWPLIGGIFAGIVFLALLIGVGLDTMNAVNSKPETKDRIRLK